MARACAVQIVRPPTESIRSTGRVDWLEVLDSMNTDATRRRHQPSPPKTTPASPRASPGSLISKPKKRARGVLEACLRLPGMLKYIGDLVEKVVPEVVMNAVEENVDD